MPRRRIRTCFACSEQEVRHFNGKVYGKLETTPNSGIVYFLACQWTLFRLSGDWCTSHLHRLVKRPLDIPKGGACYRRDARKPSGAMRVSGGRWGGVFSVFSVFSVPKLLLLQSYKIFFISPNFAWLKLAKIHQETALKLLKNIKFTALARCQHIARLRIVAFQENCEAECYAVTVLQFSRRVFLYSNSTLYLYIL